VQQHDVEAADVRFELRLEPISRFLWRRVPDTAIELELQYARTVGAAAKSHVRPNRVRVRGTTTAAAVPREHDELIPCAARLPLDVYLQQPDLDRTRSAATTTNHSTIVQFVRVHSAASALSGTNHRELGPDAPDAA